MAENELTDNEKSRLAEMRRNPLMTDLPVRAILVPDDGAKAALWGWARHENPFEWETGQHAEWDERWRHACLSHGWPA